MISLHGSDKNSHSSNYRDNYEILVHIIMNSVGNFKLYFEECQPTLSTAIRESFLPIDIKHQYTQCISRVHMVSLSCNVSAIRVNLLSWRVYLESFSKNIKKSRAFQLFSPTEMIKIPAVFAEDWDALNEAEATLRVSEKSIDFQVDTIFRERSFDCEFVWSVISSWHFRNILKTKV